MDFRGGLNTDAAPDNLADNELMECINADLSERGAISKRKGTVPLNATSYNAQVENIIEWPRKDGTKILLAVIGTTLAKINDIDGSRTDIKTLDNADIGHFFYADKLYITGKDVGIDKYWEYDGTTLLEVVANVAEDNDLAPIKRCRRFIWHPKSQRIFAARDSSDMTALYYSEYGDPTYFKGTSKLYPTTGDGPVNALSYFGEAMIVFYNNSEWVWKGVDPATDAEWYKLFSNSGTPAYKSVSLTPSSLTILSSGGIISLSPGLIDSNIAMIAGEDLVINRTENKVMSVIRKMTHKQGAAGIYDSLEGKYLLAYDDIDDIYYPVSVEAADDRELDLAKEWSEYAGAEEFINYIFDTEFTPRNSKILVYDWALKAFTTYEGLQVNDFCKRANGDLLIASNGYILKMWQGHNDIDVDDGGYAPIKWSVKTKHWNIDLPFHIKKIKKFFIGARQYDKEHSSIDIDITTDYEHYEVTALSLSSLDIDESFVWGESVWGDVWGWSELITKEAKVNSKGMRVQVALNNNKIDEPVTIYGMAFEYKQRKPRGVRVN